MTKRFLFVFAGFLLLALFPIRTVKAGSKGKKVSCTSPKYHHDESKNKWGRNRCRSNCDCDGRRTCSRWHWCQGVSRNQMKTLEGQNCKPHFSSRIRKPSNFRFNGWYACIKNIVYQCVSGKMKKLRKGCKCYNHNRKKTYSWGQKAPLGFSKVGLCSEGVSQHLPAGRWLVLKKKK